VIPITINTTAVRAALDRIEALARDTTPVTRAMGTTLKSITEGTFNSAGASFRPIRWASKRSGKASNLQKSTTLAKSFQLSVTPNTATVSATPVYAAIHQFGFHGPQPVREHTRKVTQVFGRKLNYPIMSTVRAHSRTMNMPARPFFPITPSGELTDAASKLILRAAERAIQRAVGGQVPPPVA
jgi:phage gpG-like protein